MKLKKITNFILDFLFPRACLGCQKEGVWLCQKCLNNIPLIKNKGGVVAAASFNNELLKEAIHSLKYAYIEDLGQPLGELLLVGFKKSPIARCKFDFIVPIPLHKKRFKERGFNQVKLISQSLSCYLHCPIDEKALIRRKNTASQMTLGRKDRLHNMKDAFIIGEEVVGKTILLIDDVITTGSTLQNATAVLKKAGAGKVAAIVLAKDELKNDHGKISKQISN